MNKKIKVLIISLFFMFLTAGCDVKYNLDINSNGEVKENIKLDFKNSLIKEKDVKKEIIARTKMYKTLDPYKDFKFNVKTKKENSLVNIENKYKDINEASKSKVMLNLFQGIQIRNYDDYNEIITIGEYYKEYLFGPASKIDKVLVTISLENKVISSNADKVDKTLNKYTWIITKEDDFKTINIKYTNDKLWHLIVLNYINDHILLLTFLAAIILILGAGFLYIKINFKRKNKI